ncbi:MAG: hypothetical protein P9M14_13480 [Candidatus Alcyoniella australis]|nr:hypothetical protein [Candidatus Alcyoniella australis]
MSSSTPRLIYESLQTAVATVTEANGYHYTIGETFLHWPDPGEMATKAPCANVITNGQSIDSQVGANSRIQLAWLVTACIKVENSPSTAALDLEQDLRSALTADVRRGGSATLTTINSSMHSYGTDRRVVYVVLQGSCVYHVGG